MVRSEGWASDVETRFEELQAQLNRMEALAEQTAANFAASQAQLARVEKQSRRNESALTILRTALPLVLEAATEDAADDDALSRLLAILPSASKKESPRPSAE